MSKKKPPSSGSKRNVLKVCAQPNESREVATARVTLDPVTQAGKSAYYYEIDSENFTLQALIDRLAHDVHSTVDDDGLVNAQVMLASQAYTLDVIFNSLARRAAMNAGEYIGACEKYLKVALRAQSQCRATLEAISDIKNPRTATFVKQANIAGGHQQVNNDNDGTPRVSEIEKQPNELLEDKSDERMDVGKTAAAGGTDSGGGNRGRGQPGQKQRAGKAKASRNADKGGLRPLLRDLARLLREQREYVGDLESFIGETPEQD